MPGYRRPMDPLRVLVLDDDAAFLARLQAAGTRAGVQVYAAPSLPEFGSVGALGAFDVLVVALGLHPVSGLEIADYAATFFPGLPVLILSQQSLPLSGTRWAASVAGVVSRTAPTQEVLSRITSAFESRQSRETRISV